MPTTKPTALRPLRTAAKDLLFISETDAPFEVIFWPDVKADELTPKRVAELADARKNTAVEVVTLDEFFRNAVTEEEWHNDKEAATVARFKELVQAIKDTLADPKVFRIGERKIDCYIVGGIEGGWAGLKTHVVET